ncbi:MAG: hypothetical protein CL963_01895 [Euryarchaeota archaeon]|jgi:hypothetical protein|nr:hypothetical protein [Euryarchaeota archaeon]HIK01249.1 hypothetical protein [Candidatus Undinarchaeales archaeon ERR594346 U_76725]|tara:strand:- start:10612 stop:10818 length:207 start_codon:yes stop_codon:yes gene_type:complete
MIKFINKKLLSEIKVIAMLDRRQTGWLLALVGLLFGLQDLGLLSLRGLELWSLVVLVLGLGWETLLKK